MCVCVFKYDFHKFIDVYYILFYLSIYPFIVLHCLDRVSNTGEIPIFVSGVYRLIYKITGKPHRAFGFEINVVDGNNNNPIIEHEHRICKYISNI